MKIGLIGYGKMGKMVEAAALGRGHQITQIIDPFVSDTKRATGTVLTKTFPQPAEETGSIDLFIEFTKPDTAPDNIKSAAALGKPIVCGTTGWRSRLAEVSAEIEKAGTALLWSSNFSLGVNLFYRIAAYAAQLADPFTEYDLGGLEIHHRKKIDSPSGTAKTLMERVLAVMKRKSKIIWDDPSKHGSKAAGSSAEDSGLSGECIHFTSLRYGSVPGAHSLFFDSHADTIEITHTARSREGFASGAVLAAEWLAKKAQPGIFTMEDVLRDMLP